MPYVPIQLPWVVVSRAATSGFTVAVTLSARLGVVVSAAVIVSVPSAVNTAEKACAPASADVKV